MVDCYSTFIIKINQFNPTFMFFRWEGNQDQDFPFARVVSYPKRRIGITAHPVVAQRRVKDHFVALIMSHPK